MKDRERARMVVDATVFGIRHTARTYGVSPATVHRWVHHAEYEGLVARVNEALASLAARWREAADPRWV